MASAPPLDGPTSRTRLPQGLSTYGRWLTVVVVAVVVVRGWMLTRWSWYGDDWVYLEQAYRTGFWSYVLQGYNSHLMPGQFVIAWISAHVAYLDYTSAVVTLSLVSGASVLAWGLALRELFGERLRLVAAVAVLGLAPAMVPVTLWWAAALQAFPLQLWTGLSVLFLARWSNRGQRRLDLAAMTVAYVLGLVFWQKALLITIPLLFVAVLLSGGDRRARLRTVVGALWPVAAITAVYLVVYSLAIRTGDKGSGVIRQELRTAGEVVGYFRSAILDLALPSLIGGPFADLDSAEEKWPAAPVVQSVTLCVLALAAFGLALWWRRRVITATLMVIVYATVSWSLVLFSDRYASFGVLSARDSRYFADVLPVLLLAICFMTTTPVRREVASSPGDGWRRPPPPTTRRRLRTVASHVLTVAVVLSVVGTARTWASVAPASPKPWVDTLLADAEAAGRVDVYDTTTPAFVMNAFYFPGFAHVSDILGPLGLPLRYNQPADSYLVVDETGHLRPGELSTATSSEPTTAPCGYAVSRGETTQIPFSKALYDLEWIVEITYFLQSDARVRLTTDDDQVDVPMPATTPGELGRRQVVVGGAISDVSITGLEGDDDVCVATVRAGLLSPAGAAP